jgi:hypothetical protein
VTNLKSGLVHLHGSALNSELATLRASVDELGAAFVDKYGQSDEVVQRTEALSAAIQRLEWAISRQQLRRMSAASGA